MNAVPCFAAAALVALPLGAFDGFLDPSFGSNGQVVLGPGAAHDVVATGDGLFVTGDHEASPGNFDFYVVHFDAGGTIADTSPAIAFDQVAGGDDFGLAIAAASDGKVVVAGNVQMAGTTYLGVARLRESDLELDLTFGGGTGKVLLGFGSLQFIDPEVAVLPGGSILVGCTFGNPMGTDRDFGLFQLLADGSADPNFGSGGFTAVAFDFGGDLVDLFADLAVQVDGKIVLAGSAQWTATDDDFAVARLLANGDPDLSFSGDGKTFVPFDLDADATDRANAVAITPSGRIAIAGTASDAIWLGAVAMLQANGGPDLSFDSDGRQFVQWVGGGGATNLLTGAAFESDGTLFVSGVGFWQFGVLGGLGAARLLPSGAFDLAFHSSGYHHYDLDPGWETTETTALDGGRPLLVGMRTGDWAIVRLTNALVFSDGFESGNAAAWS